MLVSQQRSGQQPSLAQNLEAVADTEDGLPFCAISTARMTGEKRAIAPVRR
jgi:hypothetical protein